MQTLVFLLLFLAAVVLAQTVLRGRMSRDPHSSTDDFRRALAAMEPDGRGRAPLQRVPSAADSEDVAEQGSDQ